jgi:penicillin-binding protein 2
MFLATEKLYFKLLSVLFLVSVSFTLTHAQRKKPTLKPSPKQAASKKEPLVKKTSSVKESRSDKKESNSKNLKNSVAAKAEAKRFAEARRLEDARRRQAEEARRRAAAEAQARRVQAIREAQARRAAFENGLRTQTVENITVDNTEGEDLEARRAAVNALGNHAGTVVVLEPQTGRVLTIVNQEWAIRKSFKPCSTIKLVTAVAGLNESLIDEEGKITQRSFPMNLDDALAYSNNAYFQRVGANLGSQRMIDYARILGLGEPTGLNVAGETGGRLPFGNNNARIYSHGDDFEVTPLQLAVMVSALSNGGKLIVPQVPRTKIEKTNFRGMMKRQITLPQNAFQNVIPGMIGAAQYGTARRGVDSSLAVAGKTGSCIGGGSWVGLFASVAPITNPKLAVVVITRGQSERGKYAAAIAGSIYDALRGRLTVKGEKNLALQLKPQSKVDAKTSAILDDADDEDSDENGTVRKGKKGAGAVLESISDAKTDDVSTKSEATSAPKSVKNLETRQGPLFPTIVITKKDEFTRPRRVLKKD